MSEITLENIWNFNFINELEESGANVFAVGGCVRDYLINSQQEINDIDLVVCNSSFQFLESILKNNGQSDLVGDSFGVIKFKPEGFDEVIDIALPRKEFNTGDGHRDFEVQAGEEITLKDDLWRRDFTINAIAMDSNFNIKDPFGGVNDIIYRMIRHVNSKAFVEDPLRMLRALQFAARFNFHLEASTFSNIVNYSEEIINISGERVLMEFNKVFIKANDNLSYFVQLLGSSGLFKSYFGNNIITNLEYFKDIKFIEEFYFLLFDGHNIDDDNNSFNQNKLYWSEDRRWFGRPNFFYKFLLKGDNETYNRIKGLEQIFYSTKNNPVEIMADALHYHPEVGLSRLLDSKYVDIYFQFVYGDYPYNVKQLDISGDDLMSLGYSGSEIGLVMTNLLQLVYNDEIDNDNTQLLKTVKNY